MASPRWSATQTNGSNPASWISWRGLRGKGAGTKAGCDRDDQVLVSDQSPTTFESPPLARAALPASPGPHRSRVDDREATTLAPYSVGQSLSHCLRRVHDAGRFSLKCAVAYSFALLSSSKLDRAALRTKSSLSFNRLSSAGIAAWSPIAASASAASVESTARRLQASKSARAR